MNPNPQNEEPLLVNVTRDELDLLVAHRKCCSTHQKGMRWFANASASGCDCCTPNNLVVLVDPSRI